jgi:methylthioribose-1-phosphate isomerase
MKVGAQHYRSIWSTASPMAGQASPTVTIIDQTELPHTFVTRELATLADAARAISHMQVRGAPLIGITAAYGVALALAADASDANLDLACRTLVATRPTAVNLAWAVARVEKAVRPLPSPSRAAVAWAVASDLAEADVTQNDALGRHGLALLQALADQKSGPIHILTHCNAGWLAAVDWGTALAPIYQAHDAGLAIHVWVDETRPRSQGLLTSWELAAHSVPHTVIADNAGGHLMQTGQVDACIVGADRVAANGDVANKIGTYLKALAADDNGVPFYVSVPLPTFDWTLADGRGIDIEERDGSEVRRVRGKSAAGVLADLYVLPPERPVANPGFDVTPARLITGIITPHGTFAPSEISQVAALREAA